MKHLVAHILILSIFSFQFSELLIYIAFKINQDYIAENLCVEKDIEGSTCKGCCQLEKKLDEQQNKKEALPVSQSEKQDIYFYAETSPSLFPIFPATNTLKEYYSVKYQFELRLKIFHPPRRFS